MRAAALQTSAEPKKPAPAEVFDIITPKPETGELGIDGIGNFAGDLYAETNQKLRNVEGYGRAGTLQWGFWENAGHTNPFVAMALDFIMSAIRDARVDVEPGDDSPEAQKQADFIRWALTENLEPGWPDFLQQTGRGSLLVGFALHELIWGEVEHEALPGGKGWAIIELAERLPSTLSYNAWRANPDTGELEYIRQLGPKGTKWEQVDLPVDKVLLNTWNRNGRNYAGFSAFRTAYFHCRLIEQLTKLTAITLVREGAGLPVAFCTDRTTRLSKTQRAAFQKLLANLVFHENASAVLPSGWDIKWIYSPGANKGHVIDTINALGLHILMLLGAQQLHLGTGSTGSRSVGEVHSIEADSVRHGVIANIEAGLNGVGRRKYQGPVKKMIDVNFGPPKQGRKYPKVRIILKKPKLTPVEMGDALSKGKAAGVFTPTLADENAFREQTGLSPIDEKERAAEKEKAAKLAPQFGPPGPPSNENTPPFAKASLRASAEPFMPRRPLRASEKVLDLQGMAKLFDASRADFERRMRPLVAELLMRALPDVKAAMADGDASDVGDVALDLSKLEAEVKSFLEKLRAEGYRNVKGEKARGRPAMASAEEDDQYTESSPSAVEAQSQLTQQRKHLVKRIRNRLSSDLEKEAIDVERTGGDPEEVVARTLQRQVDTGAFRADAGIVTTKAFNVGRDEFAQESGDQVTSVELSAVMDLATCGPCELLDGQEFDFNSAEHEQHVPPLSSECDGGDNCRCILIYNFDRSAA